MQANESKTRRTQTLVASLRRLCLAAFLALTATSHTAAQSQQTNTQQKIGPSGIQRLRLSPEAARIADEIGVAALLEGLGSGAAADSPVSPESVGIRQEIIEKILAASLDVDSVNAIIDVEVEQIRSVRSDLQSRRDKAQNIINVASMVTGSAFGALTSALQFKSNTVNLGNGIGVAGGTGSVLLSVIGIRKQRGELRSLGNSPRMLARFFGRQPDATEEIPSAYPEVVWSYLNSPTPSQPNMGTRKEQLVAKWRSEGRIAQDSSPQDERRIESVSSNISQIGRLSIDELTDRVAMLLDVRARVSLMKRGLSEILRDLSKAKGQ